MPASTYIEVAGPVAKVKIPVTPSGWELYSKPGAVIAARKMANAMKKALAATSRIEAIDIMRNVMTEHRKLGALDTEPRWHAERLLSYGRGEDFQWTI